MPKFEKMPEEKGELNLDKKKNNEGEQIFVSSSGTIETLDPDKKVEEAEKYQKNKKEYE